jgi:SanA protein
LKAAAQISSNFNPFKIFYWLVLLSLAFLAIVSIANWWIIRKTTTNLYFNSSVIPENEVGLVLGTSKYNKKGNANKFFENRIQAAANLYHSGKIKHIIVSGDNRELNYNEPRDMRRALIKKDVPESAITLDFAGFRTLDSVVRSKKVFGQNKITIISQKFHTQRALFIASYYGIDAVGYCAVDPPESALYTSYFREFFARFKAVLDLYVIKIKPKFLGKQEVLIIQPQAIKTDEE